MGQHNGDQRSYTTEGKKIKPMPRILGSWNMTIKMGEREFNTVLAVTLDKQKKLQAEWQSEWGEHEISDVQFKDGKLTFSRASKFGDREWKSTYEGTRCGSRRQVGPDDSLRAGKAKATTQDPAGPQCPIWRVPD